jgi:hypothetical protein
MARGHGGIGKWLKSLSPKTLGLEKPDGDVLSYLVPRFSTGKIRLADCERDIERFQAVRLEARDKDGNVLGVYDIPRADPQPDAKAADTAPKEGPPGYAYDAADTREERLLKTFAHLLADAHSKANAQLVTTVGLISQSAATQAASQQAAMDHMEKAIRSLERQNARFRQNVQGIEGDAAEEGIEGLLKGPLGAMIMDRVGRMVTGGAAAAGTATNGVHEPGAPEGGEDDA